MDHEDYFDLDTTGKQNEDSDYDSTHLSDTDSSNEKRKRGVSDFVSTIPGHLASPIYATEVDMLIEDIAGPDKMRCFRHRAVKKLIKKNMDSLNLGLFSIYTVAEDPIQFIQDWVDMNIFLEDNRVRKDMKMCISATENVVLQKINMLKPTSTAFDFHQVIKTIRDIHNRIVGTVGDLFDYYKLMKKAERLKDEICFKNIRNGEFIQYKGLFAERDLCFMVEREGVILIPTSLLLCALDKMQCEFGLVLNWRISDIHSKYPGQSIETEGRKLLKIWKGLRSSLGQDFFTMVGSWEALVVGWTIAADDDLQCLELFLSQAKEIRSILLSHSVCNTVMRDILPPNRSKDTVLMWLELVGMSKIFGYPTLVAEKLLDQVRDYGTSNRHVVDDSIISELKAVARRDFSFQYKKKRGIFPPIVTCPPQLSWLKTNKAFQTKWNTRYDLWSQVKFGQCLNFNFCPDASELVRDSATSINKSSWAQMYDGCGFYLRYGRSYPRQHFKKSIYKRRTIEHYLCATEDEVKKLVLDRDRGIMHEEDKICVECGKECELKVESGRAFTKQTPPQRLIQTVLELNVAEGIFPYVPQQSMVDGEIRNTRRILEQVKMLQSGSQFVSLDLKKWCLFQRHESTSFIGEMYDELFGFKQLYTQSHLFFNSSNVFTTNRLAPPDFTSSGEPIPGPLFLNNFIGGMEGMQQKKWTHVTECLIQLTLEKSGVQGEIMGQGDNQVIILKFKKHEPDTDCNKVRSNFLMNLDSNFKKIHHELKEKETWFSRHLHEYSKQRIYKGVAVSNSTKKSCRIIPDINDGLFSITSSCATLNTITEGIARADYNADVAFYLNQFLLANYILRKDLIDYDKTGMLTTNESLKMRALLMTPADFGGLPLSTYYSHSVRGNDDKVVLWIDLLKFIKDTDNPLYRCVLSIWQHVKPAQKDPLSMRRLIEDVYSLNISSLPSSERKIKEMTLEYLKSGSVTNPAIKKLYFSNLSKSYNEIIITLSSMKPMYPQLAHEILKNSNAGTLLQLQNKLTATKTIEKIVSMNNPGDNLIDLIMRENSEVIRILRGKKFFGGHQHYDQMFTMISCPCEIADKLRVTGWGVEIVGVTKSIYSHQAAIYSLDDAPPHWRDRGITVRLSDGILMSPRECYKKYGPMKPYVGSQTKEKIKKATVSIVEKTSYIKSLQKLGKLRSWSQHMGAENITLFINQLIDEKKPLIPGLTGLEIETDDLFSTVTSGNPFHRMRSEIDHDTAMVNCLPSITGHFEHDSNTFKSMTLGGKDYSVFFQLSYISNITSLAMSGLLTGSHSPMYLMVFPCEYCSGECPSPDIDLSINFPRGNHLKPLSVMEDLTIEQTEDSELMRQGMSVAVGLDFARNIDKNFTLHHERGVGDFSNKEFESFVVSLNDLRILNTRVVLETAFLHSHHVRSLYYQRDSVLRGLSEDRSFVYLAERYMQSGSADKIIELLDIKPVRHAELTTFIGFSNSIADSVVGYLERNAKSVVKVLYLTFKEEVFDFGCLGATKFALRLLIASGSISKGREMGIKNWLTRGNVRVGRRLICKGFKEFKFKKEDMITKWRATDRSGLLQEKAPTKSFIPMFTRKEFPSQEVNTYHLCRANSVDIGSFSDMKYLSFIARPSGVISSAPNKFLEIISGLGMLQTLKDDERDFYCLAEGSGGTFETFLRLFPESMGGYNTLMLPSICNREIPSDCNPPAVVAARGDLSRIIHADKLASGTTDILSDIFLTKLKECFRLNPPKLVTIDAESPNRSNNLQFVEKTVYTILSYSPLMVICKMFFLTDIEEATIKILEPVSQDYHVTFYKPISSNPTGPEVYLVVAKKDSCTQEFARAQANWSQTKGYIQSSMNMSRDSLVSYCKVALMVSDYLTSLTSQRISHKYHQLIPGSMCGLYCNRLYRDIVYSLEKLHTHEEEEGIVVLIRRKGTNSKIASLLQEFLFLTFIHSNRGLSLHDTIIRLHHVSFDEEVTGAWRKSRDPVKFVYINPGQGSFLRNWYDVRMYLREYNLSSRCRCPSITEGITAIHIANRFINELENIQLLERRNIFRERFPLSYQEYGGQYPR